MVAVSENCPAALRGSPSVKSFDLSAPVVFQMPVYNPSVPEKCKAWRARHVSGLFCLLQAFVKSPLGEAEVNAESRISSYEQL